MPTDSIPSTPPSSAHSRLSARSGTGTTAGTAATRNGDTVAAHASPRAAASHPPTVITA